MQTLYFQLWLQLLREISGYFSYFPYFHLYGIYITHTQSVTRGLTELIFFFVKSENRNLQKGIWNAAKTLGLCGVEDLEHGSRPTKNCPTVGVGIKKPSLS